MNQINITSFKVLLALLGLYIIFSPPLYCQTSGVKPTQVPGSNSVSFDAGTNKYKFYHNGILRYEYSVLPGTTTTGGTFNVLRAYADNGTSFLPSNFGGIRAYLSGAERYPWDPGVSFVLLSHQKLAGDTVRVYWQMKYNSDYIKYVYKFKIVGRTLITRIEIDLAYAGKSRTFELDRCELAQNPAPVAVPYLSLFHVLYSNDIFTSFFVDWELSNASQLVPWDGSSYSGSSIRYAQTIYYNNKANSSGQDMGRNRMLETLYLTTSPNLEDVLPNVPNPVSEYKEEMANQIVWDYRRPFGRLDNPWQTTGGDYLDRLWNAGVRNLWVQIHDWQHYHNNPWGGTKSGYDDGLPCVLPANEEYEDGSEFGGPTVLNSAISKARGYDYRVGLHQNYVDYYPAPSNCDYNPLHLALDSDGNPIETFLNEHDIRVQSHLLKPSLASTYVDNWSNAIQLAHSNLNGCYLDVHSSLTSAEWYPVRSNYVDYDISVPNAGMFRGTLQKYRELYSILRTNHNGPVQGEGGNQIFYQGYVDDIEARLITPTAYEPGYNFPLLVDFDMLKLHSKTMVHGVGWYPLWKGLNNPRATYDEVLSYIATELAYGHGAYLCDEIDAQIDFIQHAQLKYKHVFSVQKDYANATPTQILYNDNGSMKTASDYIRSHPTTYDDISSPDFMSQVKIEYNNGVIICVNRHPTRSWILNIGVPGGWFNYNTSTLRDTGVVTNTSFNLPPNKGWVVFDPLKGPLTATISGPSHIYHPPKNNPPNVYTWNALVSGGTHQYTYKWFWNNVQVGTGSSYTRTLNYDGIYPAQQRPLRLDVRDPNLFTTTMIITEHSAGDIEPKINPNGEFVSLPNEYSVQQNYPNPFNPSSIIKYALPEDAMVQIKVYDILGKEVTALVNEIKAAGYHETTFDASELSSGIYIYRIITLKDDRILFTQSKKMLVVK